MRASATAAYWWTDIPNFGDRLTPHLLRRFASCDPMHASIEQAQVVTVGSVLEQITASWHGVIAGAGKIARESRLHLVQAHVLGVRGPLSAEGLGDVAIGDPGLLAPDLVQVKTRDIALGIVPHWSDTRLAYDQRFTFTDDRIVISAWQDPLAVVAQIGRCERIVTSSLHGAIVADAFGLPRRIEIAERFKHDVHEGKMFKFADYHASIGMNFKIGEMQKANWHTISDRRDEVYDMYRLLESYV
jgi:pyruvyltransferase